MWSQLAEIPLIKALGWGSFVLIIGSIVTYLRKIQVVTSLTSTKVERLLFTKEKRLFVNLIQYLMQTLFAVLAFCFLTPFFYEYGITHSAVLVFISVAVVSYIVLMYISLTNENFLDRKLKRGTTALISVSILFVHILCLFMIIPGYLAVVLLNESDATNINLTGDLWLLILGLILFLMFISGVLVTFTRHTAKLLFDKFNRFLDEYFYITEKETSIKWFIYYPIDNDYILLGNKEVTDNATIYRTLERKKVLEEKIYLLKVPKIPESTIEFNI
ncbi:hypothetical protein ACN6KS_22505 [Paenibacillus nitricinens]|uniref:hypothetical protein n=1 Tax=Paenibacillus nitricinens TaxID=3367691 RepID=UPI003F84D1B5